MSESWEKKKKKGIRMGCLQLLEAAPGRAWGVRLAGGPAAAALPPAPAPGFSCFKPGSKCLA